MTQAIGQSIDVINSFDEDVFKNKNMQKTLTGMFGALLSKIEGAEEGAFEAANNQLQNAILGKADGCQATGTPDKNDWLLDCAAQQNVTDHITAIRDYLTR